jgi:predicted nuclease with TOPRIM domain
LSTLGKILTVLVVLVSIAVGVLVTTEVVLRDNWRQRYEEEARQFQKALEQRDKYMQQRDDVQGKWDADAALKQQQIETLSNELALMKNTNTTLRSENENQEKRLQELTTALEGLKESLAKEVADRDTWRKERDDARKEKDDLLTMYTQLEAKYRAALADLANSKENLLQTAERLAAAESRLEHIRVTYPNVRPPEEVPALPTAKVQGMITKTDNEARVAEINLGTDDGVVKGMKFFVYNKGENKYLATLLVNMVSKNSAAGELSVIRGTVKVNDHVTNRFE